jgi:hypothetical protein
MSAVTTFDSTKESLLDLLRSIRDGKTQLPDFLTTASCFSLFEFSKNDSTVTFFV